MKEKPRGCHQGRNTAGRLFCLLRPAFLTFHGALVFLGVFFHFITVNSFLNLSLLTFSVNKKRSAERSVSDTGFYTPFPVDTEARVHWRVRAHTPLDLLCQQPSGCVTSCLQPGPSHQAHDDRNSCPRMARRNPSCRMEEAYSENNSRAGGGNGRPTHCVTKQMQAAAADFSFSNALPFLC